MRDRLSFFIDRPSPLHRLNPLTKLTLAFTLIILAFFGPGYWLASGLFLLVLVPLSLWGRVQNEFLRTTVRLLLPLFSFLFAMQSLFYPGGRTILFSLWFLSVKAEGVSFAYLTATRILVMVTSFLLLLLTTHPSTLMSDLARRGVPGALAYIITSTLQILPQMQAKANTIIDAQRSRGLDTEGSLMKRVGALLPLVGPLVFGSLVDVEERAIAIEARAFNSPRPKTSLIEIPDSNAERIARRVFVALMIMSIGSRLWLSLTSST
jgi:energy-coupling factor transport system permease protein